MLGALKAVTQNRAIPAWVNPTSNIFSFDLQNSRVWCSNAGKSVSPLILSCTRAETGTGHSFDYLDDLNGNWIGFPANVTRCTNKWGAYIEGPSTNGIRNNSMQGASAPSTLPTNWAVSLATGITVTTTNPTTTNGIDTVDITFAGTTGSTGFYLKFEAFSQISAAQNDVWTESVFLALVGGDLTNVSTIKLTQVESPSATDNAGDDIGPTLTATLNRFAWTKTLPTTGTSAVQPTVRVNYSSGVAINFTLRVGWPQQEKNASPTTPIRTTSAALTRNVDLVTFNSGAFGGANLATTGSMTVSAVEPYPAAFLTLAEIDDGAIANVIQFGTRSTATTTFSTIISSSTTHYGTVVTNLVYGFSAGFAWATNDFAESVNGAAVVANSGSLPSITGTTFRFGSRSGGGGTDAWYGGIRKVDLFSLRVANGNLQTLSNDGTYLGQVATRTLVNKNESGINKQLMARSHHIMRTAVNAIQIQTPNWYNYTELSTGGTQSITQAVEYPAGIMTRVLFGGAVTGTIPLSSALLSDVVPVNIPAGADFWVRTWISGSGIVFNSQNDAANGDAINYGVSGIADQTMGGTITNLGSFILTPSAIIGLTKQPSVYFVGDSRVAGTGDSFSGATSDLGELARSIGPQFAYINGGISGNSIQEFVSVHALQVALSAYCSHVIIELGINDATNSRTANQIEADLNTAQGYFTTQPVYQTSKPPVTTSTDSFATLVNQTTDAGNGVRVTVNDWVRTNPAGYAGYFEIANVVESSQDSGLWAVNGTANWYTADGTHESHTAYLAIQSSGNVNTAKISR